MSDSTMTQTTLAYQILNEGAYNEHAETAEDYQTFETTARILPIPDVEKQQDEQRIGGGAASAYPSFQRSGVLIPQAIDISDIVNVDKFPIFANMYYGTPEESGDIAVVEASKAWRHFFYKQNFDLLGRQLPSKTFAMRNNGAAFLYTGGVGGTLQVSQNGITDPRFTFGVVTSGNYLAIDDINDFGEFALPTRSPDKDMLGAETILTYNDGSSRSLQGRWKSFNWQGNNNIDTGDLRAGLARVNNAACPTRGWYRNKLLASDETVTCTFRVAHDDVMREWDNAQKDTVLTTFDILMKGQCIPTTAANNQYAVKISHGKGYFRNIRGGDDNNTAVIDVDFFPVRNGSYFGTHRMEIVNGMNGVIQTPNV